jgi:hypothetical protein
MMGARCVGRCATGDRLAICPRSPPAACYELIRGCRCRYRHEVICTSVPVSTCRGHRGRTINNATTRAQHRSCIKHDQTFGSDRIITLASRRNAPRVPSYTLLPAFHHSSRLVASQITGQRGAREKRSLSLLPDLCPLPRGPSDRLTLELIQSTSFTAVASLRQGSKSAKLYQMPSIRRLGAARRDLLSPRFASAPSFDLGHRAKRG